MHQAIERVHTTWHGRAVAGKPYVRGYRKNRLLQDPKPPRNAT